MIELSNKEIASLIVCFVAVGACLCYLIISHYANQWKTDMEKELITAGELHLRNITFLFRNAEEMHEAYGTASNWNNESIITLRNNMTRYSFLVTCNHEVLHLIFCDNLLMNSTEEEEYVEVLDDYVRFPICSELLEMVE